MKTKFKIIATFALALWLVVFIQIAMTRLFVSQTDFTEAFTRNQVSVTGTDTDSRNQREGNTCVKGQVRGKLTRDEMRELASGLFRTMGGVRVMESEPYLSDGYYMAYGFSNGFDTVKKVNGRRINMNIAMSYDEEQNCTNIIMGAPLVNSDI